jgi:L-ascorbate metabolism protein UlaG (beta-lactamase superfamily)
MEMIFWGQSCWQMKIDGVELLIDPWLTGNPQLGYIPDGLNPDYILVTHNHTDHVGDAIPLAKKHGSTIIATPSHARHYEAEGAKAERLHLGGRKRFEWGSIKAVQAFHDSPLSIGNSWRVELGAECGFVIEAEGKKIYHAGDTCLFSDMSLWAPVDVALLPMDGQMVMESEDAVRAAQFLEADLTIPIHWRSADPHEFVRMLGAVGLRGQVPEIGKSITI